MRSKTNRRPTKARKQRLLLTKLEDRVLFSAAPLADLEIPNEVDLQIPDDILFVPEATESREFVFIDPSVEDFEALLSGISDDAEVVLLDGSRDGLTQIAEALDSRTGISAIHIVSHGNQAELQLGDSILTSESMLGKHAGGLEAIRQAMSADADILIYGCDFGQGAVGAAAANQLAYLTGADVAASNDLTGNAQFGGDWELEFATGTIETGLAFDTASLGSFVGTLQFVDIALNVVSDGTPTFDPNDDPGNDSSANNGIIRSHDIVNLELFYNADAGGATNPIFTSTLPDGMVWEFLPPQAAFSPNSGIFDSVTGLAGGDMRTIVMQIPDIGGTITSSLALQARALGVQNGTPLNDIKFEATTDENPTTLETPEDIDLVVSSGANMDIRLLSPYFRGVHTNAAGTDDGVVYQYSIGVLGDHPTRSGTDAVKGSAPIEASFTFDIDLANVSPNAQLFNWGSSLGYLNAEYAQDGITRNYERFVDNAGVTRTVWSHGGRPAGQTYEHPTSGAWQPERSVPDSGDWTATQSGQEINVTVTGADTSGQHFPTRAGSNGLLPAGDKWFASGMVYIWIPIDDILPGADGISGTADDGALQVSPEIVGFDPDDAWGDTNNFGEQDPLLDPDTDPAFLEDTANNDYTHTVLAASLGGSVKRIFESGVWRWVDTSTYWYSGDGVTSVGHQYDIQVHSGQNLGVLPVETPIWGDKFDNTAQKIVPIANYAGTNRSNSLWSRGYSSGQATGAIWLQDGVDYVVEFGTGGEGGVGATWSDWDSMGDATLADGETSTIWTTDPTDPALGGTADPVTGVRDSVTKWRTRLLRDLQPGEVIYAWVSLETTGRSTLDPVNNPTGDIIADQMAQYRPTTGAWITSEYDPSDNSWNSDGTSSDIYRGDRLTYVDSQVRIDKQIIDIGSGNLFLAGSAATVQIEGTVTIPGPDSGVPAQDVIVTDILPAGLTVVAGSVSPQAGDTYLQDPTDPSSSVLTVQAVEYWDGTSWSPTYTAGATGVRWDFGDVPLNTELPTMTFEVLIPFDAQNGEEYLNNAVIASPSDSSEEDWRDSQAGLVAVQTVAFSSGKSVLTPLVPEDGTVIYELGVANVSTDKTVPWFDAVDILPYDNDFDGSSFSGNYSNIDVTSLPAGIDVYVSSTASATLDSQDGVVDGYGDPGTALGGQAWYVAPGTVGSQWEFTLADAQGGAAGAPAMNAITALRFVSDGSIDPHLPAGESLVWNVELDTNGNVGIPSDHYTNSFVARTNPLALPLPVFSPAVTATVVAPDIEIEKEVCLDETGANCDLFNDAHWGETATFDDTTTATFRVKVVNTGTADLTTTVTDNLPAGMTYVAGSASPTLGDVSGFPPSWTLNLAAGATAYMTFDASTANATDYTNTASVSAVDQFGEVVVDSDPADVEFVAEISVTKHQTDVQISTTNPDRWDVTYEVEIENTSVYDLTQLTLTEDLNSHFGAGYTGVISSPSIIASSLSVSGVLPTLDGTWNGMLGGAGNDQMFNGTTGTLKPGDSMTVEFTVEVDLALSPDPMNMQNQVTAGAANGVTDDSDDGDDPNSDNPTFPGDDGVGGVDDPTPLIIPHLEFEKKTVSTTPASSGTLGNYDVTFDFTFWTDGNDPLSAMIFEENFASQYGGAFVGLVGTPAITATTATDVPELSVSYDGGTTNGFLFDNTGANTNLLEYGQSVTLRIVVEVDPNSPTAIIDNGDLVNKAGISAQGTDQRYVDASDDPDDTTDVNPDGDNDPDDPNRVRFPLISLLKGIRDVSPAASGTVGNYDVTYELEVENTGSASLDTLSLVEDFAANYGGAFVGIVTSPSIIASSATDVPELNAAYDGGTTNAQLFDNSGANTNLLVSGETISIRMVVEVDPDNGTAVYDAISSDGNHDLENQASVAGTDINSGEVVTDNSDDPNDATDVDDDSDSDPDDPTALIIPEIELIKSLVGSPVPAASGVEGNFEVTFDLQIINHGTTQLNMLTLQDDLANQYGGAFVGVVGTPTIQASTAADDPEFNAGFDGGTTDAQLFDNTGANSSQLLSGETVTIRIVVEINPDAPTAKIVDGDLTNAAGVSGDDEYGDTHIDNDDSEVRIPLIGLDKEIVSTPPAAASGTQGNYDVTYQFTVTNDGSTDLDNITLQEDFAAQFGGAFVGLVGEPTIVSSTAADTPEINASYDGGATDAELFDNTVPHPTSAFTFAGSNTRNTVGRINYVGTERIVIDPNQTYDLEVDVFAGDGAGGNYDPLSVHYIGFVSYDIDGNVITSYNYMKFAGSTDTTLASPLNPGDTTITLTNASGWSNAGATHTRTIAWYGDQDSAGNVYPDYTYTRNFAPVAWDPGGISGNVITLNTPWAGPALNAGDAVRNAQAGGTYQYSLASYDHVGQTTETLTATIGGGVTTTGQYGPTLFRPGTHSISALVLADYTATGTELTVTDFEITPNCESLLKPGESVTIEVTVEIDPNSPTAILDGLTGDGDLDFENQANVTGDDFVDGTTVDDHSDDPTDTANSDDDGDGEPDDPTELIIPDISMAKRVRIPPSPIGQNWEVFYELTIENTGNTALSNLTLLDDVASEFGNAYISTDDLRIVGFTGGSAAPIANLAWETNTAASLITGGTLNPGATFRVWYSVIVDPDGIDSVSQSLENQATVEAEATNNSGDPVTVSDLSDSGDDPNTDNGEGGTDDPTLLLIADLGITKEITGTPYKSANGNYKVDYSVVVENIGTIDLADLSLIEDLAAEFGAGFVAGTDLAITAGPTDPRSSITLDAAWNGSAAGAQMVDLTAANLLAVGDQFTLTFCVEVDAEAISGQPAAPRIFTDEAAFAAASGATLEEDFSHIVAANTPITLPYVGPNGVTIAGPIVTGYVNPVELRADPDFVTGHAPEQGVIAFRNVSFFNGTANLRITVPNPGTSIGFGFADVFDPSNGGLPGESHFKVTASDGTILYDHDEAVDGQIPGNMYRFIGIQGDGATTYTHVDIEFETNGNDNWVIDHIYGFGTTPTAHVNQIEGTAQGVDADGNPLSDAATNPLIAHDLSDNGSEPSNPNTVELNDSGGHDDPTPLFLPCIKLEKELFGTPVPASSGTAGNVDITYDFTISNTGTESLETLSLIDDLSAQYGGAFVRIVPQAGAVATIVSSTATDGIELNAAYDGGLTNSQLVDNSGVNTNLLEGSQSITVRVVIEIDPDNATAIHDGNGNLENQATTEGTGTQTGTVVDDLSDDPNDTTDDDPNSDGNPDDPNVVRIPLISLEKQVIGTPVSATSGAAGNFDVTYQFVIENTGTTSLDNLTLIEDLATQFDGAFIGIVGTPAITATTATDDPAINAGYDGTAANSNIFDASVSLLDVNETITVQIVVEVDPDSTTATYDTITADGNGDLENQATVTGDDTSTGTTVDDHSDDPTDTTNNDDDSDNDPDDPTTLLLPAINLEKSAVGAPVPADSGVSGNFDITYDLVITNTGNEDLSSLSLVEDLAAQYGGAFVQIVGSPTVQANTAADAPEINAAFDGGTSDSQLFDNAGANTNLLAPNESVTIRIVIEIDPDDATAIYNNDALENQATVEGTGTLTGNIVDDDSDDPTDPTNDDPDTDNNPDDPNLIRIPNVSLQKQIIGSPIAASSGAAGNFDVTYNFTITNTGTTPLDNLSLVEDFAAHFGGAFVTTVRTPTIAASTAANDPGINAAYDGGTTNAQLFDATTSLINVGETVTIQVVVEIDPDNAAAIYDSVSADGSGDFENQATVTGDDPESGDTVGDNSDSPTDASDNDDDGDNDPDDPTTLLIPDITLEKQSVGAPVPAASGVSGNFDVTYDLVITNTGNEDLSSLSLVEDLASQYGGAFVQIVGSPTFQATTAADVPEINAAYDGGTSDSQLFDNTGANTNLLAPNESVTIRIVIEVDPDDATAIYNNGALENQATTEGAGTQTGNIVDDDSDDPTDPTNDDPDTDNNPDDPNPIRIPNISLEKEAVQIIDAGSGTRNNIDVTYEFTITNTGTTPLDNLTLVEDFATQFGGAFVGVVGVPTVSVSTAADDPGFNAAYDGGTTDARLFDASSTLLDVGESVTIRVVVELDPDNSLATYDAITGDGNNDLENQATATGDDPATGDTVNDNSDDPTDAIDSDDDSDNDPDDPTAIIIPDVSLTKSSIGNPVPALSGTEGNFDVTFEFTITNTGQGVLTNMSLVEDFRLQYGGAFVGVTTPAAITASTATDPIELNAAYDGGATEAELFDNAVPNTNLLDEGESITLLITVELDPNSPTAVTTNGDLINQATTTGTGEDGTTVSDHSDNPADPTDDDPDDDGNPDDPNPIRIPNVSLTKQSVAAANASSGTANNVDIAFEFVITNTGTTDLENLTLGEDFAAQFGGAFVAIVGTPTITASTATDDPGINGGYDGGTTDATVFDGSLSLIEPNQTVTVQIVVELDRDNQAANYDAITGDGSGDLENQATVTGDDPATSVTVDDNSDSPTDPTNNDDDGDNDPDDPTTIIVPDIELTKSSVGTPVPAVSGTLGNFDITFEFTITNIGQGALTKLSLIEDFATQYGGAFVGVTTPAAIITSTASDAVELNGAYDGGTTDAELFDSALPNTNLLDEGESITLQITVEVDPNAATAVTTNGDLINQAETTGTGEDGVTTSDESDNPSDATNDDPDDDDNPDDPNPIRIPNISLTKQALSAVDASSGTENFVDVTFEFVITNTGTTDLENLSLAEDFAANFGGAFIGIVGTPTITASSATDDPAINAAFDGGTSDPQVFDGSASLIEPNQTVTVQIVVEVDRDNALANYDAISGDGNGDLENQATTSGDDPTTGTTVDDNSDNPTNPTNNDDDGDNDPDDPTTIAVPDVELEKSSVGAPVPAASGIAGNFDVTFEFEITNIGDGTLTSLSLLEDFQAQFGGAFVGVTTAPAITTSTATDAPEINAGYDGSSDTEIFDNSGVNASLLDEGESVTVQLTVEIDPDSTTAVTTNGDLINQATTEGNGDDGTTPSDNSDDPTNPTDDDPDNDGGPDDPTDIRIPNISLTKQIVGTPVPAATGIEGNFDVVYELVIENDGTTPLENLTLTEDMAAQFGGAFVNVVVAPTITTTSATSSPTINSGYDGGTSNAQLFDGSPSLLDVNQRITIQFTAEIDPDSVSAVFDAVTSDGNEDLENQASITGDDPATGDTVDDNSDNPTDPTNSDDDDDNDPDDPTGLFIADITLHKQVVGSPLPSTSGVEGNFDVTYQFTITNTGNAELSSLSLLEDFATQFGGAFVDVVTSPSIVASTATDDPGFNAAYDGGALDAEIFDASAALLDINQSLTIELVVEIDPNNATANYDGVSGDGSGDLENQATTSAQDPNGGPVEDTSDDPTDPTDDDSDDDNNPDDPTGLYIADITLEKTGVGSAVSSASGAVGNFDITYDLTIANTGNDALASLSLLEDLATQYGGAYVQIVGSPTIIASTASDNPEINTAFDGGATDAELFNNSGANTNLLDVNESLTVRIIVEVDPDNATANYTNGALVNQATTEGTGTGGGDTVTDHSDDPTNPTNSDPDDDNSPDDPNEIRIPSISIEKSVPVSPVPASSGTAGNFDVTYQFVISNDGTTPLINLTLLEDLATQFGGAFVQVVSSPAISNSTATTNPALNLAYDGGSDAAMFDGASGLLDVNQTITLQIVVELDPDSPTAVYDAITGDGNTDLENQAEAAGDDPETGHTVTDLSDDPNDADDDDGTRDDPSDDDNDPDDPVSLFLPNITLHKSLVAGPVPATSGTAGNFELAYDLEIVNTGNDRLANLSLLEDLATQYGGAFSQIVGSPSIVATTATDVPEINTLFDGGTSDDQLFDNSGLNTNLLMPGEAVTVRIVIGVDPDNLTAIYSNGSLENQAAAAGDGLSSGDTVTDNSDDQSDPTDIDPDDDNNPDDPSNIRIADITLDKVVDGTPVLASSGTFANYDVTYRFTIENTGTTPLNNIVLTDDWASQFGAAFVRVVPGTIAVINNDATTPPGVNSAYTGGASENLLDGTGLFEANQSFEISLVVEIDPNADGAIYTAGQLVNQAHIVGDDPATGLPTGDSSDDTNDPTDSDPDTDNNPDDPTTVSISEIGAAKRIVSSVPISTSAGHVELTYEIRVRNLGSTDLDNLTLQDDFLTNLGPAFHSITAAPTMYSSNATIEPTFNTLFDGATDIEVFDGTSGSLKPGEEMVVRFTLDIQVDLLTAASMNQGIAGGSDSSDNPVSDPTDTGSDPEGTNPNQTGDTGGEDDPTLPPAIGLAKDHGAPTPVGEDWLVPVEIHVRNLGLTDLQSLVLTEDISAAFGGAFISATVPVVDGSGVVGGVAPTGNASWAGNTTLNLLDGTGYLTPNDAFIVSFDVLVDPDANGSSTYLFNQSSGDAEDPKNPDTEVTDTSDSGSDTTGANPGEPGDSGLTEDPTPLQIPDLGLAKQVIDVQQNGAAFDVTVVLLMENIGTVDLANLTLTDDIVTQFLPHTTSLAVPPAIVASTATTDPGLNAAYAGLTQNIFDGVSGLMSPGEAIGVTFTVTVLPDYSALDLGRLELVNQATTTGVGFNEDGSPVVDNDGNPIAPAIDLSDDGTDADGNNFGSEISGSIFTSTGFGGTGGVNDPTMTVIQVFAWDSYNDFSRGHSQVARLLNFRPLPRSMNTIYTGMVEPGTTLNFSIYDQTGLEIGNRTVVADAAGNWLAHFPNATVHSTDVHYGNSHFGSSFDGSSSSMLSEFGARGHQVFHGNPSHRTFGFGHLAARTHSASTLGHRLYHMPGTEIDGQPHRMEMRQTPAIYNTSLGAPNMHWSGQRHFQPGVHSTNYFFQASSIGNVFTEAPSNSLRSAHAQNSRPLQLGLDANELEHRTNSVTW